MSCRSVEPQGPPDEGRADFPPLPADRALPRIPKQERSRAKRDALLRTAARLFAERGFDATTTTDIAAAAGVSVGTLYSYFQDKRQILLTFMADTGAMLASLNLPAAMDGPDPRQTLRRTLARALPYGIDSYRLHRAWMSLRERDPELAAYGIEVLRWIYHELLVAIRRAHAEGKTWPDLDMERTCWTLTMLLDHVWHSQLRPELLTEEEFCRQRDALADLVYHAIFSGAAAANPGEPA